MIRIAWNGKICYMGTIKTRESEYVEAEARSIAPDFEIECAKDFDTKDYTIWLTKNARSFPIQLTMEDVADRDWRSILLSKINAIFKLGLTLTRPASSHFIRSATS
jgi:hypothetical protein